MLEMLANAKLELEASAFTRKMILFSFFIDWLPVWLLKLSFKYAILVLHNI